MLNSSNSLTFLLIWHKTCNVVVLYDTFFLQIGICQNDNSLNYSTSFFFLNCNSQDKRSVSSQCQPHLGLEQAFGLESNLKQQSAVGECAQALCHEELAAACLMSLGL